MVAPCVFEFVELKCRFVLMSLVIVVNISLKYDVSTPKLSWLSVQLVSVPWFSGREKACLIRCSYFLDAFSGAQTTSTWGAPFSTKPQGRTWWAI